MKESFVFFETWAEAIRQMPDKERLQVFDAIMAYGIYGAKTEIGGLAQMALNLVFNDIDDCKKKRNEKTEKARESANKRWQKSNADECERIQTDANAYECKQTDATQCYNVNVNVNGNVNENVNVDSVECAEKSAPQPKPTTEEREQDFMFKVANVGKGVYPDEMLRKFFDYWTEKNENGKKMRFEKEKVFDIKRRLATWASRDKEYKFKTKGYGDARNDTSSSDYVSTERIVAAGFAMAEAGL